MCACLIFNLINLSNFIENSVANKLIGLVCALMRVFAMLTVISSSVYRLYT